MSLYQKHRPTTIQQVHGNNAVKAAVESMLSSQCPHALLFVGDTGCGKTTMARIIANGLKCANADLYEVDAADFRGIDTIRDIRRKAQYAPTNGPCRVWILDECHKLSPDAQPALLKLLEEPPKHAYFILCTTDPQKLLPTIKGRCVSFQMKPLSNQEMLQLLRSVCKAEDLKLEKVIYDQLITDSLGLPRNALTMLEKVMHAPDELRLQIAQQAAVEQSESIELCRALIGNVGWKKVANLLKGLEDQNPESIRRHVRSYCKSILLNGENDQAAKIIECFSNGFFTDFTDLTFAAYAAVKG